MTGSILAVDLGKTGCRVFDIGAGTPGRLAVLDATELGSTYSAPEGLLVPLLAGGEAALDAHGLTARDAVVGIVASGRTPFVVGGLQHARARGALSVAVANDPGSPAATAELAIEVLTGPEPVAGSTQMLAGTGQKIVLNALSTSAMLALGKPYGNRMVDVPATTRSCGAGPPAWCARSLARTRRKPKRRWVGPAGGSSPP